MSCWRKDRSDWFGGLGDFALTAESKPSIFPAPEIFLSAIFLSNLGIGTGKFFAADLDGFKHHTWFVFFGESGKWGHVRNPDKIAQLWQGLTAHQGILHRELDMNLSGFRT